MKRYFALIINKIRKIEKLLKTADKYENIINPFSSPVPKTYVWIDEID